MAMPEDDPPPGVPEWVVTYGDMMSLLLTFFIMLVSMAEMKQDEKLRAMMDAWNQRFGPTAGKFGVPGPSLQGNSQQAHAASKGSRSQGGVEKGSRDAPGTGGANEAARRLGHGKEVTIGAPVFFEPTSADLTESADADLQLIANVLRTRVNRIVVRGHATSELLPDDSPFRDAMELAFARARTVSKRLLELNIAPDRLQIGSAGDAEPRVVTRDPVLRRTNHRVDVFLIDSYTSQSEARSAESAGNK